MTSQTPKVQIGTSGWSYNHWKNNFYPAKMASKRWLNFYASVFYTVEVNTAFYRTPLQTTTEKWFNKVLL